MPLLRLTVPISHHKLRKTGHRGILWQEENAETHLLFEGILVANPAEKKEDFVLLILEAGRADKVHQLERGMRIQKQKGFEPLLVAEEDQEAIEEILEACSVLPHWDRLTGNLTLAPLEQEREVVEVGPHFFRESLDVREVGRPLSAIRFSVTVEWVQRYDGVADVSPLIQQAGTRGYLSTLTAADLQRRWWKKEYPLNRTGYEILESRLTPLVPPSTGALGLYPLKSASFTVEGRPQTVRRTWLQPVLKVQWHYRQKRKETVHIEVPWEDKGEVLELAVRLQDICSPVAVDPWKIDHLYEGRTLVVHEASVYRARTLHFSGAAFDLIYWERQSSWPTALEDPSRWSFFMTPRGHQVMNHGVQRARAYGMRKGRRLEVRCRLPFALGRALKGNQDVRLEDARLPEGHVTGQIVQYRLIAEGDAGERWADVALRVQKKKMPVGKVKELQAIKEAQGILDPCLIRAEDLVTRLEVTHGADIQSTSLEGKSFPSLAAVHRRLEKGPTRVKIELKDLKPTTELSHEWKVVL